MEGSVTMRDLRDEMYASGINDDDDNVIGDSRVVYKEYVTKEEFNRKIKMLERQIAMLEAKLHNINGNGWDNK